MPSSVLPCSALDAFRMKRDEGRNADSEIDVETVFELRRGAARHFIA
jgi:hypothetical protein